MEKDTVVLDLNTYNELRDFKTKTLEGKTYIFHEGYAGRNGRFITSDEAVEIVLEENKKLGEKDENHNNEVRHLNRDMSRLRDENIKLTKELGILVNDNNKIKETFLKAKKMSIWEFFKWREK